MVSFSLAIEAASSEQERVSCGVGLPPPPRDVTQTQETFSLPSPAPLAEGSALESDETTQPGLGGC